MKTTRPNIRTLYALRLAASIAGDTVVVASCDRAIKGDAAAKRACAVDVARYLTAPVRSW